MARVDWDLLKTEYVTNKISIANLAEKYNVKVNTVQSRSNREKWGNLRKENAQKINEKCIKKTINKLAEKKANAIEKHFIISNNILNEISKALSKEKELYTYVEKVRSGGKDYFEENLEEIQLNTINEKKVNTLVNAFKTLQEMQRQTLDILDIRDKKRFELEEKKIDSDKNVEDLKETITNFLNSTKPTEKQVIDTFEDDANEED